MLECYLPIVQGRLRQLIKSEKGATAVEYGLMVAAIAAAIIVIIFTLGENLATLFTKVSTKIGAAGA